MLAVSFGAAVLTPKRKAPHRVDKAKVEIYGRILFSARKVLQELCQWRSGRNFLPF